MTGPAYPLAPAAGSNAPGTTGAIGVMSVGDISTFDPWDVVISQYANSPILDGMILSFAAAIDMTQNFDLFFDWVVNPETAIGFGLDIWGRIVGISRTVNIANNAFFGFKESGTALGFGQAQFWAGQLMTTAFQLNDQLYRNLIFAKALANISDCSIPSINKILLTMFPGRGNCWVADTGGVVPYFGFAESTTAVGFGQGPFWSGSALTQMTATYTFTFPLSNIDLAMINSGVLPTPTGVQPITLVL